MAFCVRWGGGEGGLKGELMVKSILGIKDTFIGINENERWQKSRQFVLLYFIY